MRFQIKVHLVLVVSVLAALAVPALGDDAGWVSLFDGKSLEGWTVRGGKATYKADDGAIVGTTVEGSPNTFLCRGDYKDFVLEFEVKCDPALNSGVQVRSHFYEKPTLLQTKGRTLPAGTIYGPQCEIAAHQTGTSGNFWDEARRTRWLDDFAKKPEAAAALKDGEWNKYKIAVQGQRYRSWINGVPCADFTDATDERGLIGLQVHQVAKGKGPYEVRWRNIRIKELRPGEQLHEGQP
jgi:hypothetical protein